MAHGRAAAEVAAVLLTALAYGLVEAVSSARLPFILAACALWGAYGVAAAVREPGRLAAWGVRRAGLWPSLAVLTAAAAPAAVVTGVVAARQGRLGMSTPLALALALYPLWGLVQQFLVQAMVTRNVLRWTRSPWVAAPAAAALFAGVHAPNVPLMAATFAFGLVCAAAYCRWRNLLPLGLYHGWLGALFYVWVLGRDPWLEALGG